ncbi:hypothetical protein [Streptomyces sp. NPDC060031]|uniref:hypothetical protein n=1 Tax=Streptomyces sp. NPDC060031 TaxID=3347043 RepID=UPI00369E9700
MPLLVGAGVLAVALAAGGAWYLTGEDQKKADQPKDTAAPGKADGSAPAPRPSASASAAAYTVVFKDKPLKLLATREFGKLNDVDLDFPKVAPFGEIASSDRELQMGFEDIENRTPFGKSTGPAPELCEAGAATNPIPARLPKSDLTGADSAIVQGDLLCTVTSKGNLAMIKIITVEPSNNKLYSVPTYLTEVTLWKRKA